MFSTLQFTRNQPIHIANKQAPGLELIDIRTIKKGNKTFVNSNTNLELSENPKMLDWCPWPSLPEPPAPQLKTLPSSKQKISKLKKI